MPIQPNFLERFAFFTLNAAPTPMLDMAGALGYQALSTAVRLNLFETLQARPQTLPELARPLAPRTRSDSKWGTAVQLLRLHRQPARPQPRPPADDVWQRQSECAGRY